MQETGHRSRSVLSGVVVILAAGLLVSASAQATAGGDAARCAALGSLPIPAGAIGLPTSGAVVDSAAWIGADAPGNRDGAFCRVLGRIDPADPQAPPIRFEVNLPADWNRHAVQFGGGAYDGVLVTGLGRYSNEPLQEPTPLAAGYVTLGSDGGHAGFGFDGRFALNKEALWNYGRYSVKKTHDAAMAVVSAFYGARPQRMFFIGGSQGGHEALVAAALYPQDYDGVVANYPAYNITLLQMDGVPISKALYDHDGAGWLDPAKVKLLTGAVYAACDRLDGAADGIISDVAACRKVFTLDTVRSQLRCPGGADTGDTCLSDAQIATVATIDAPYAPGFAVAGMTEFPRWPILEGAVFRLGSLGTLRQPTDPAPGREAFQYLVASGITRYFITRDPQFDPLTFVASAWKPQVERSAAAVDITDASLAAFAARGGKIILMHGTIDDLISPYNSVAYYQRQFHAFGQQKLDSFLCFYLIPGMGHGFGVFSATYDSLGALEAWVGKGHAPGTLLAIDANPGAHRTRPMCLYPDYPRFTGGPGASLDDAASFTCTAP